MRENFGTIKDTGTACKESKNGAKIWQVFSLLRAENANLLCNSRLRGAGEVFHLLPSVKTPHRPQSFLRLALALRAEYASDVRSNRWRESQNRLAEFGLHGNIYLLPWQGNTLRWAVMTRLCAMEMMTARADRIWSCSGN